MDYGSNLKTGTTGLKMIQKTYRVYGDHRSGNCYKVALILSLTGRPYQWHETNVMNGETRTPEFLSINPNGRVPLLQLPDGRTLPESNAILLHLAEGTPYLPGDSWERARVYQWLFFEQYSHEPAIAVARFIRLLAGQAEQQKKRLAELDQKGHQALCVMETVLKEATFFAGPRMTVADIALYAYTHVAGEGGFDLAAYPEIRAWLSRVAAEPGHFDMNALAP
jgi:glutathione S-transferase